MKRERKGVTQSAQLFSDSGGAPLATAALAFGSLPWPPSHPLLIRPGDSGVADSSGVFDEAHSGDGKWGQGSREQLRHDP